MLKYALLIIVLLILFALPGSAMSVVLSKDAWMGVYLGPNKIGYMHTTITREKLQGKDVYCMREVLVSRLRMEGKQIRRDSTTTLYFGDDLRPIQGVYEDIDNGATTRIEAQFVQDRVLCKATASGTSTAKSIAIPPGTDLSIRLAYEVGRKPLAVGDEITASSFDPVQLAVTSETLQATRREDVLFRGEKRSAMVILHGIGRTQVTDWRLDSGELAKSEMPGIGAVMVALTKEDAMADLEVNGSDLDAVKADKPIPNPRRVSDLKLRLIGMPDKELVKSDARQSVEYSPESLVATYHIKRQAQQADETSKSPKPTVKHPENAVYLKPTEGIEASDTSIISQARKIIAGDKNTYRVACKLRTWVQSNVRPSDEAATALSAVDVLRKRVGCCRHNAVLYAALARAVGIPTRLAGGLIYDSGSFHFHVWAESWVNGWIPLDPTYPGDFVDATHIKLVEGGLEDLPALGRVAGRLRAEIISAK